MDELKVIEIESDNSFSGNVKVRRLLNTVPDEFLRLLEKLEKEEESTEEKSE